MLYLHFTIEVHQYLITLKMITYDTMEITVNVIAVQREVALLNCPCRSPDTRVALPAESWR